MRRAARQPSVMPAAWRGVPAPRRRLWSAKVLGLRRTRVFEYEIADPEVRCCVALDVNERGYKRDLKLDLFAAQRRCGGQGRDQAVS